MSVFTLQFNVLPDYLDHGCSFFAAAAAHALTREELRYIPDRADVQGPGLPGETFRVLKEKEMVKFGEYRTRRLVLEAWHRLPQN